MNVGYCNKELYECFIYIKKQGGGGLNAPSASTFSILLKVCERSSSREERQLLRTMHALLCKRNESWSISSKADGSHVEFLGFAAQYLEVYVCILVYLTYVFDWWNVVFFSIEFSKLHVPGKTSCVVWYKFDLVPI